MSSRNAMLETLRRNQPPAVPLPELPALAEPRAFAQLDRTDALGTFVDAVRAIAGTVVDGGNNADIDALLAARFPAVQNVASMVAGVGAANVRLDDVADPHELAALDVLVCEAEFGVAENGAVWLPESRLGHRAAPFLAEHMVVLLDRNRIVRDMHEAYARVQVDPGGFGLFMAGPSKTADIEQALVIGAHGPRSLTILLI